MIEFRLFGIIGALALIMFQFQLVKKNGISKMDAIAGMIFGIYCLVLIKVVFFPIPFQTKVISLFRQMSGEFSVNLIPTHSILEIIRTNTMRNICYQIGGNLLLLLPMGMYLSVIFSHIKWKRLALVILGTSVSIEFIQLVIGLLIGCQYRVVDVDDIILNVVGGIFGLAIGRLFCPLYQKICRMIST